MESGFLTLKYILQIDSWPHSHLHFSLPLSLIWIIATASQSAALALVFSPPHCFQLPSSSRIWYHPSYSKSFHVSSVSARLEPNSLGWFWVLLSLALWTSLQPHFLLLSCSNKHWVVQAHHTVSYSYIYTTCSCLHTFPHLDPLPGMSFLFFLIFGEPSLSVKFPVKLGKSVCFLCCITFCSDKAYYLTNICWEPLYVPTLR